MSRNSQDFLSVRSLQSSELQGILSLTDRIKDRELLVCEGQTLILLFEKPSTRTRVSLTVGFQQLGGRVIFLGRDDVQLARGETVADTARTLSRYAEMLACRTFQQKNVEILAESFGGPVINALTDRFHPCQALSDVYTIFEHSTSDQPVVSYVGDGNNVCHSLMEIAAQFEEIELKVANPPGHQPDPALAEQLTDGTDVTLFEEPEEAVSGADFVYTDVWVSMGDKSSESRLEAEFENYQVNSELLSHASEEVKVMHCLPAHRGEEITDEVMDGSRSIVFDQAENRLWVQKALMGYLLAGPEALTST